MKTYMKTYTIRPIPTSQLVYTDLLQQAESLTQSGIDHEAYAIDFNDNGNVCCMIHIPQVGRAGIAFGADAAWTDCDSPEDAAERYFGVGGKSMVN